MLGADTPADLMNDFERKGVGTDEVDTVFLTHLHGDHVGWNTRPEDLSKPTFEKARDIRCIVRTGSTSHRRRFLRIFGGDAV